MLATYFRSSSYNRYDFCPHAYFMEYNLGWNGRSGKAAVKGTTVHKVLEIMAMIKKAQQNGKKSVGDVIGRVKEDYDLDKLIEKCYKYYTENEAHIKWVNADYKDVNKWTHMALELNNGQYDPREREIWDSEPFFDFIIDQPWSSYSYQVGKEIIEGQLSIKGTIDLILKVDDNTLEICDWKTGQKRTDWATGKEKNYDDFMKDFQLRLYHYAAHLLYPEFENIIVTICYVRAGGPFTLCFSKDDLKDTEEMIKKRFEQIKKCKKPFRIITDKQQNWKCKYLCDSGKTTFEGTHIAPMQEFRRGQKTRYGDIMSKCEQVHFELERKGMESVLEFYTEKDFSIGYYHDPGGVG